MSRSLFAVLNRRFGPKVDGLTRREMLKATLATGAGLLLSNRIAFGQDRPKGKRVVVVGAGFGGLAAAHELGAAGYEVTVVEARNRMGGRVLSFGDLVTGKNVEGGGELIGSNHPTWVAYADKFGLSFLDVTEGEDEAPIVLGGKRLTAEESEALWKQMEEALAKMNEDAAKVDADLPWKSPNAEALDRRSTAAWVAALDAPPLCKLGITTQLMSDNGALTSWQSYLGNLAQVKGGGVEKYWTDSEVYRCKGGNAQLAAKLAGTLEPRRLLTGAPAAAIATGGSVATVTLADGKKLEADDVVLAVPPTTWRRIAFDPTLPSGFAPQMGSSVKFLAALKDRFWKVSKLAPDSLTDGDVHQTWEGTDSQPGEEGACLVAFSGAAGADNLRARKAEERTEAYLIELERTYPDIRKSFTRSRFMDWPGDPWTGAGYSFPAPGQVTTMGPILREGFPRLHFAGEHACPAFVGYMEGALNSGAALAGRLAKRDGVAK